MFNKKSIGLDISDGTIEVVELNKGGSIVGANKTSIEDGIIEGGRIKDKEKLAKVLNDIFAKAKPKPISTKEIVFGLPDSQVYTQVFVFSKNDKIDELVKKELQKNIPIKFENLFYDYKIISEDKEKVSVLAMGIEFEVISGWLNFFQKNGFSVEFGIEALAVYRGLFPKGAEKNICIVDIGQKITNVNIFNQKGLVYSHIINIAGDVFTKKIATNLKIDQKEAEELKIKSGLAIKKGKVGELLKKELDKIIKEINKTFKYLEENQGIKIENIILVGGSSQMSGLLKYFTEVFKDKVQMASLSLNNKKVQTIYLEAVGLALKARSKFSLDIENKSILKRSDKVKTNTKELVKDEKPASVLEEQYSNETNIKDKIKLIIAVLLLGGAILIFSLYFIKNK